MKLGLLIALVQAPAGADSTRQFEKAVGDLEGARRLNPELPRLHYFLGLAYFETERFDDARTAFESELKRAPKDVSSLCFLASMDDKEGRFESERRRLDVALSVEPASPDANWLMGKILTAQGRATEAVRPLQVAVSGDPLDTQKRYQLARAYQQIGRKEDAERELAEMKRLQALEFEKDQSKIIKP